MTRVPTKEFDHTPQSIAAAYQSNWMTYGNCCHGLLAGYTLAQYVFLVRSRRYRREYDSELVQEQSLLSKCVFDILITSGLITICDTFDVAHLNTEHFFDLFVHKKSALSVVIYWVLLLIHLMSAPIKDKYALAGEPNSVISISKVDEAEFAAVVLWETILAMTVWILISLFPMKLDLLYIHLNSLAQYNPQDEEEVASEPE